MEVISNNNPVAFTFADHDDAFASMPARPPRSQQQPMPMASSAGIGADEVLPRPSTPPPGLPRLLTATKVNVSARGVDEVHPLAAASNMVSAEDAKNKDRNNFRDLKKQKLKEGSNPDLINRDFHTQRSTEMSEMTSLSSSKCRLDRLAKNRAAGNIAKNEKLRPKQQAAMDKFLEAQLSGNPLLKEERWRELVMAMKEESGAFPLGGSGHYRPGSYNRGRGGSRGSNKSWSSGKDDILGLIRIGGGLKIGAASDAVSIASGLTSAGCSARTSLASKASSALSQSDWANWDSNSNWDKGRWVPTPTASPMRDTQNSKLVLPTKASTTANNAQQRSKKWNQNQSDENNQAILGGGEQGGARVITPPNVPMLSNITSEGNINLPIVSPLSLDGSFDEEEEVNDPGLVDFLNVTGETTIATNDLDEMLEENRSRKNKVKDGSSSGGKKEKKEKKKKKEERKNCSVFFDIGESFADNNKHLWNDNDKTLLIANLENNENKDSLWNLDNDGINEDELWISKKEEGAKDGLWKLNEDPSLQSLVSLASLADSSEGESQSTWSYQHSMEEQEPCRDENQRVLQQETEQLTQLQQDKKQQLSNETQKSLPMFPSPRSMSDRSKDSSAVIKTSSNNVSLNTNSLKMKRQQREQGPESSPSVSSSKRSLIQPRSQNSINMNLNSNSLKTKQGPNELSASAASSKKSSFQQRSQTRMHLQLQSQVESRQQQQDQSCANENDMKIEPQPREETHESARSMTVKKSQSRMHLQVQSQVHSRRQQKSQCVVSNELSPPRQQRSQPRMQLQVQSRVQSRRQQQNQSVASNQPNQHATKNKAVSGGWDDVVGQSQANQQAHQLQNHNQSSSNQLKQLVAKTKAESRGWDDVLKSPSKQGFQSGANQQLQQQQQQSQSKSLCQPKHPQANNETATGGWDDVLGTDWDSRDDKSKNNFGLIAQSNDGEVLSFQDIMEKQATPPPPLPPPPKRQQKSQQEKQKEQLNRTLASEDAVVLPRSVLDASARSKRRPHSRLKKRGNGDINIAPAKSLEEQVLDVVVLQEKEKEGGDIRALEKDKGLFGRSSSLLPLPTKVKKPTKTTIHTKSHEKSTTVGSAASAQDILRELNSTPCMFQSGNSTLTSGMNSNSLNSAGNSISLNSQGNSNLLNSGGDDAWGKAPPFGSISTNGLELEHQEVNKLKHQQVNKVKTAPASADRALSASKAPSSEESSTKSGNDKARRTPGTLLALAPSRRDRTLSRPNRLSRRSSSEPETPATMFTATTTALSTVSSGASTRRNREDAATRISSASTTSSGSTISTKPGKNVIKADADDKATTDMVETPSPVERSRRTMHLSPGSNVPTKPVRDESGENIATSPVEEYCKTIDQSNSRLRSLASTISVTSMKDRATIGTDESNRHLRSPGSTVSTKLKKESKLKTDDATRIGADSGGDVNNQFVTIGPLERYRESIDQSNCRLRRLGSTTSMKPKKDNVMQNKAGSGRAMTNRVAAMSPMERHHKTINQSNGRLRSAKRLFPLTSPATPEHPSRQQTNVLSNPLEQMFRNSFDSSPPSPLCESNPFDSPSIANLHQQIEPFGHESSPDNPFDSLSPGNSFHSPPRLKPHEIMEDPFEEHSSPIPVEQSLDLFEDQNSPIPVESSGDTKHREVGDVSLERPNGLEASSAVNASASFVLSTNEENNSTPMVTSPASDSKCAGNGGRVQPPSPQARMLAPSKRDTFLRASRTTPSLFATLAKQGPARNVKKKKDLDEIRASITQLKHNGVGGVGKSTSTLVRNEETGRYVIRDMDDDHFDDIINSDDPRMPCHHCPKVIDEEGEEEEDEEQNIEDKEEHDVKDWKPDYHPEQTRSDVAIAKKGLNKPQFFGRDEAQTPLGFAMANQIMGESVLDDDAVEDAVRAATECLSTASSTTSESFEFEEAVDTAFPVTRRPAVEAKNNYDKNSFSFPEDSDDSGSGDFFAIRRPPHGSSDRIWNSARWATFGSSSVAVTRDANEESMDDWGGFDDSDSFAPGPQWDDDCDDDSCWGNNEEKLDKKSLALPSPISVVVSKTNMFPREG